jgi:endonuclease/exonuclease/phosphatase family metal-dependent hydrolase
VQHARRERVTIASYNIHSCVGMDGQRTPARTAAVLKELDCDVFALQEVDNRPGEHEQSMQLDYLARTLDMAHVPGLRIVRHTGEYGNAILTRLPIVSVHRHDLSYSRYEPRGAVDVQVLVNEQPLRVIAAHLGLRRAERRFQWQRLMVALAEMPAEMPTVLLGDMNEWYRGALTLKQAADAFGEPPAPAAFPSFAPLLALTRMWVRPRNALLSMDVHRTAMAKKASDHLPVKAVLEAGRLAQRPAGSGSTGSGPE